MRRVIISSILILVFILAGSTIAVLYAKGYRFGPQDGKTFIEGTGLLVVTSKPEGARVLINGKLTTATNNTINLSPGEYNIAIEKDGYVSWKKQITVKKEVVTEATALLFPTAPKLEAVTTTGAANPVMDPTNTLLAYTVSSASATKNGIYILDMNATPIITIGGGITQLTNNSIDRFSEAKLSFSPDGKNILAQITGARGTTSYLLSANGFNDTPQDVTTTLDQVQKDWEAQSNEKNKKIFDSLSRGTRQLALTYFKDLAPSLDGTRISYTASTSGTLNIVKSPKILGGNSTPETRTVKQGNVYVYDIKDDRNFLIFEAGKQVTPKFIWKANSTHLVYVLDSKINVIEYDGTNSTTVYAGPFLDSFVFPWTDGFSLVMLTKLNNPSVPYNLYRIGLR